MDEKITEVCSKAIDIYGTEAQIWMTEQKSFFKKFNYIGVVQNSPFIKKVYTLSII